MIATKGNMAGEEAVTTGTWQHIESKLVGRCRNKMKNSALAIDCAVHDGSVVVQSASTVSLAAK